MKQNDTILKLINNTGKKRREVPENRTKKISFSFSLHFYCPGLQTCCRVTVMGERMPKTHYAEVLFWRRTKSQGTKKKAVASCYLLNEQYEA